MLPNFLRYFMAMCSSGSIVLNALLLVVISLRSGKDIGSYKYLFFAYTFLEFTASICTLVTLPVFSMNSIGIIFYATTTYLPQYWSDIFVFGFIGCFLLLAFVLTVAFVYRYFVFCNPQQLIWFEEKSKFSLIIAVVLITASELMIHVFYFFHSQPQLGEKFKVEGVDLSKVGYMGMPIVTSEGGLEPSALVTFCSWSFALVICMSIIVYIIVQMLKSFNNLLRAATRSLKLIRIQKNMFALLILQTAIPSMFGFLPTICTYTLPYLGIQTNTFMTVSSVMLPLAQFIEPILIFVFVRDYRITVRRSSDER